MDVKAQTDDMHGASGKGHRNFGAAEITHAQGFGGCGRSGLPADFVMVGQGP